MRHVHVAFAFQIHRLQMLRVGSITCVRSARSTQRSWNVPASARTSVIRTISNASADIANDRTRRPRVSVVVAVAENGVIGWNGDLPWNQLQSDKDHLYRCIRNNVVVHGSKIFEEIGGKPLPGCSTIVLSRDPLKRFPGAAGRAASLSEGLRTAQRIHTSSSSDSALEVCILGGSEIYRQAIPIADTLWLTVVRCRPRGDTFFPDWWRTYFPNPPEAVVGTYEASESHPEYSIYKYERPRNHGGGV